MPTPIMVTRWGFSLVPFQPYVVCYKCGSKYTDDLLGALGTRYALECSSGAVCVHCCDAPPPSVAGPTANIKFLVHRYGLSVDHASLKQPVHEPEHLPGEPGFEHEVEREPAVCRWCKGKREITVNFKTQPCEECANSNGVVGPEVSVDWKVTKKFCVGAGA